MTEMILCIPCIGFLHCPSMYASKAVRERRFTLCTVERAQVEHSWATLKIQLLKMYKLSRLRLDLHVTLSLSKYV